MENLKFVNTLMADEAVGRLQEASPPKIRLQPVVTHTLKSSRYQKALMI
jgi:hypothetical protein